MTRALTSPKLIKPHWHPWHSLHGPTFTWWGCRGLCLWHDFLCLWHKPAELAQSFLFCSWVCFCLYGLFNYISVHKFSRQLSVFSLCSSGLISALLVLSTIYLFMKVSLSPDIILCGWLVLKHQLTNLANPRHKVLDCWHLHWPHCTRAPEHVFYHR